MKKLMSIVALMALLFSIGAVSTVQAQANLLQDGACEGGGGGSSICTGTTTGDPIAGENGAIVTATSIVAAVAGFISVIMLGWGGFQYITSGGDSSNTASAKQTIMAALIGLVIAALARPIVMFIISRI